MSDELYKYLKIERDPEEDEKEIDRIDQFIVVAMILLFLSVPLIILLHVTDYISPVMTGADVLDTGKKGDVFSFYKYRILLFLSLIIFILYLYKVVILKYSFLSLRQNIFLSTLALFIAFSTVFSDYKELSVYGMYDRKEGAITYLAYLILFFVALNTQWKLKSVRYLIYTLYPFIVINTILGLLYFYGYNLLEQSWVMKVLRFNNVEGISIGDQSRLIFTLSHGNYISGISAVLIVLLITWSLLDQNKVRKAINLFMTFLCFAMLLASLSVSGFLTLFCILPFCFGVAIKLRGGKSTSRIALLFAVISSSIYLLMAHHNPKVWDETFGFFLQGNPFENVNKDTGMLNSTLFNHVHAEENSEVYRLPQLPESGVGLGSGRLYIWKEAIRLILQRPLFGYGLDTFAYFFPQDDPEKQANLETHTVIVDKPHSMYIGIAYGAGIGALLSFMCLMYSIFICVNKYFKPKKEIQEKDFLILSTFFACVAYLFQGLFNDSIIGTAVVFWVLLGVLVSLVMQREQEKVV
ncbi:O-antigen ligase family protein [Anoxybacillus flavithermus]|uniref:O-antigen ligase family protein n=1 Tax=Anoxybacillus TaxID=150247 RepID=UPI000318EC29|nr:O-antigen ligase family protein [Anoxybacillus flavithermus]AXM89095.1 O-antigen polymerase [Anoxybacillus ayderensis G10]MBE2940088.1 O-antigen ligase family protein [Anoxybacillus flavithermus]MBE2942841.1 O-antigen ligase family protein [Anoxybacillus flavithermus]MBE2951173.1 O-antigen ligase family protein [Anoxybacillus flavithermus]MBE2953829.1 O-antigen ligase family protein [Anoxybacillus flavithermus]